MLISAGDDHQANAQSDAENLVIPVKTEVSGSLKQGVANVQGAVQGTVFQNKAELIAAQPAQTVFRADIVLQQYRQLP